MKKSIIFIIFLLMHISLSASNISKSSKLSFDKNQVWIETISEWKKDKYPVHEKIQLYKNNSKTYVVLYRYDKSVDVLELKSNGFETLKECTPISDTVEFKTKLMTAEKSKINKTIKKFNTFNKKTISIYGYDRKWICIEIDDNQRHMLKYSKFLKLLNIK